MDTRQTRIRWITTLIAGLVIICLTMAIAIVQAEQRPFSGRDPGFGGPGRAFGPGLFGLRIADLSETQREQVHAILDRHEVEVRPLWEQHRVARTALEDAITASAIDEGTIRQKSAEVGSVEAELAVIRARINAEVMTLLTPEQQKELQENRARIRERLENGPSGGRRAL
jgi:Spy/CpxP family protein refolding chaperone